MPLLLNGTDIKDVLYNGAQIDTLQFNGSTVWTRNAASEIISPGTVIFESSISGTHKVNIPVEGMYNVECIGAGGGAATYIFAWGAYANRWRSASAGGGSGGVFKGDVNLLAGEYDVVIGKGGNGYGGYTKFKGLVEPGWPEPMTGGTGGYSSFNNIVSYGGTGGYAYASQVIAGKGGSGASYNGSDGSAYIKTAGWQEGTSQVIYSAASGGKTTTNYGKLTYGVGGYCENHHYGYESYTYWWAEGGGNGYVKITKS